MITLEPVLNHLALFEAHRDLGAMSDRRDSTFLTFNSSSLPPDLVGKFDPIQRPEA